MYNLESINFQDDKIQEKKDGKYRIYRYKKKFLNEGDYSSYGLVRSVIFNENRLVSFSPPKSLSWPSEKDADISSTEIFVEEFVEGIMINVFWDDDKFVFATRSSIGGNSRFFDNGVRPNPTFGSLFEDTCDYVGLSLKEDCPLKKDTCYSFVMQHPSYRIVNSANVPSLCLVAAYKIEGLKVYNVSFLSRPTWTEAPIYAIEGTRVRVPKQYMLSSVSYNSVMEKLATLPNNTQGIVLSYFDENSVYCRLKVRNEAYQEAKLLRGNNPKLEFHYLTLRIEGKIGKYLQHFPEHREKFSDYKTKVEEFTTSLYQHYREIYILRTSSLGTVPSEYRSHLLTLHQLYNMSLRNNGGRVNFNIVKTYVNSLHPARLMYALNFKYRPKKATKKE